MPKRAEGTGEGKRSPLNMRTTREIREKLEGAAERSGRSLAQEVEFRLERSIATDEALGGPHVAQLARMVAANVALIESFMGAPWTENDDVRAACATAVGAMLRTYVRAQEPIGIERAMRVRAERIGSNVAAVVSENPDAKDISVIVGAFDALVEREKRAEQLDEIHDKLGIDLEPDLTSVPDWPKGHPMHSEQTRRALFDKVQRLLDEPDRVQSENDLGRELGFESSEAPYFDRPLDPAVRRNQLEELDRSLRSEFHLPPRVPAQKNASSSKRRQRA